MDLGALEEAGGKVITCVFKDDGRVLSVFAKRARGLMARHIVLTRAKDMADLEAFSAEGYRLDRKQCSDGILVFVRSKAQRVSPQPSQSAALSSARGKKRDAPAPAGTTKATSTGTGGKKQQQKAEKKGSTARAKRA